MSLLDKFNQKQLLSRPNVRPGDLVKIYQKDLTKEGGKSQIFEGVLIARKGGSGKTATITVRRETGDIAVEKTYPLHSPVIEKIEIVQRSKVRRAKLYYLRDVFGKGAQLRRKDVDLEKTDQVQKQEAVKESAAADREPKEGLSNEPKEAEVEKLADSQA